MLVVTRHLVVPSPDATGVRPAWRQERLRHKPPQHVALQDRLHELLNTAHVKVRGKNIKQEQTENGMAGEDKASAEIGILIKLLLMLLIGLMLLLLTILRRTIEKRPCCCERELEMLGNDVAVNGNEDVVPKMMDCAGGVHLLRLLCSPFFIFFVFVFRRVRVLLHVCDAGKMIRIERRFT